jgi:predicted PurR-regulated permease PerM
METKDATFFKRLGLTLVITVISFQVIENLFSQLSHFLMLLLLAWLSSIALEPIVRWFELKGYKRGLGAGAAIVGLLVFITGFMIAFGSMLFSQLSAAVAAAPDVIVSITNWLNQTFGLGLDASKIISDLNLDTTNLTPVVSNLAGGFLSLITGTFIALFDFMTVLFFAFYFSADANRVRRTVAGYLKPEQQQVFLNVWTIAVAKTGGFVISRLALSAISATVHGTFFWAIGVPYWLPMAIFAGITSQFVPTVGTYLGIAVPLLFTVGTNPIAGLYIVVFATIYQQIENYVLAPKVSRATMDMHPAIALAAVFIGNGVFGPIGAIIGIPVVAGGIAVAEAYTRRHEVIDGFDALGKALESETESR